MTRYRRCRWLLCITAIAVCLVAWRAVVWIETPRFHGISLPTDPGAVPTQSAFVAARDTRILDVAFSPDGSTVYAYLQIGCVNVFSLLACAWPELALAAIAVFAAIAARLLMRRRPTTRDPHCRRCDYSLAHATSDLCPECGLELTRRNRVCGRRSRRRLVAPLAAVVVAAAAYVPLRADFNRFPGWRDWLHWPSSFLFDQAYHRGYAAACNNHRTDVFRLIEVDPETGRVGRTLLRKTEAESPPMRTLLSSRGGTRFAVLPGSEVNVFDASTGRAQLRFEVGPSQEGDTYSCAALSSDGAVLVLGTWDGWVEQWSMTNGSLLGRRAVLPAISGGSRLFLDGLVPLGEKTMLLVARRYVRDRGSTMLLTIDDGLDIVGDLRSLEGAQIRVGVATIDGGQCFGWEERGKLVAGDPRSNEPLVRMSAPGLYTMTLALSLDDRLLFAGRMYYAGGGHTAAYDPATLERVRGFGSSTLVPGCFAFSSDGATLAVAGSMARGAAGQQYAIALFDLGGISAAPP